MCLKPEACGKKLKLMLKVIQSVRNLFRSKVMSIQAELKIEKMYEQVVIEFENNNLKEAIRLLDEIELLSEQFGLKDEIGYQNLGIGVFKIKLGQPRQAITSLEKARTAFATSNQIGLEAACVMFIGFGYYHLLQPQQAIDCFKQAEAVFLAAENEKYAAGCYLGIGMALNQQGHHGQAMERIQQARKISIRARFDEQVAECDMALGLTFNYTDQPQQALDILEKAKSAFIEFNDIKMAAECDLNMGLAHYYLNQPREAIAFYQRAKAVFVRLDSSWWAAGCDINIGNALYSCGDYAQGLNHIERAREVFLGFKADHLATLCSMNMALALDKFGSHEQAIHHYEQAISVFQKLEMDKEAGKCDCNLGTILVHTGKPREALLHYKRARKIFHRSGFKREEAICNANIGIAVSMIAEDGEQETSHKLYVRGLKYLDASIQAFEQLRIKISVADNRIGFFEHYANSYRVAVFNCLRLGRIADALTYLERSRAKLLAEAISSNRVPDRKEVGEAIHDEFVELQARIRRLGLLPQFRGIAEYQIQPERSDEYAQAYAEFELLVTRIASEFPDSAFARGVAAAEAHYLKDVKEYVGLLSHDGACLISFLTWGYDGRLRAFLVTRQKGLELLTFEEESLKQLDALSDFWMMIYAEKSKTGPKEIVWETCLRLNNLIFDARAKVTYESSDGVPADREEFRLRDYLDKTLAPGSQHQPRRLYLIPHASLFFMPLHACFRMETVGSTGESSRAQGRALDHPHYLLEDYEVIYTPSTYLLKLSQQREYLKPHDPHCLVVGNPAPLAAGLKSLQHATDEARSAAGQFKKAGWKVDLLIEEEATKESYLFGNDRQIAGINMGVYYHQHLAQHGSPGRDGQPASLIFRCDGSSAQKGACYSSEIAVAPLQGTRSVVAATCYSSAKNLTEQEVNEYTGLGAAFLQAGAGTFIGTLYSLHDLSSTHLVSELYRLHLKEGLGWAESLRQAQLTMLRGEKQGALNYEQRDARLVSKNSCPTLLTHPYYWASFILVGKE